MSEPTIEKPLLTRLEAAKYLRIGPTTLNSITMAGKLARVKFGENPLGRNPVLYRKQDLDKYISDHVGFHDKTKFKPAKNAG